MSSQVREPAVSGLFYEDDPPKLLQQLEALFDEAPTNIPKPDNIQALIVPHAGYVYSGKVAATAFSLLPRDKQWDRIFIIGSSHRAHFNGAAVCQYESFWTPLGLVEIDKETTEALIKSSPLIKAITSAHENEHSLEVQLPFLQYYLANPFKIVPLLLGTQASADCRALGDALRPYFTPNNLFIISTDFSHYPPFKDATTADNDTATAIATNKPTQLIIQLEKNKEADFYNLQTSLCGWTSVLTLMYMTEKIDNTQYHKILYENSGHSPIGDKNRVVGYWAMAVETSHTANHAFLISEQDKTVLLNWSRQCLTANLKGKTASDPEIESRGGLLHEPLSAFVTLHKNGRLRGCIGRFDPNQPLWDTIREMTHAAAFNDQRFPDVTIDELNDIDIELSVLSPMRKIASPSEIILGKHGVLLKKGGHSATFLPQVATQNNWTLDEFLGHLSNEKAGLGPNGWKTAELFVYEAIVFGEKQH